MKRLSKQNHNQILYLLNLRGPVICICDSFYLKSIDYNEPFEQCLNTSLGSPVICVCDPFYLYLQSIHDMSHLSKAYISIRPQCPNPKNILKTSTSIQQEQMYVIFTENKLVMYLLAYVRIDQVTIITVIFRLYM